MTLRPLLLPAGRAVPDRRSIPPANCKAASLARRSIRSGPGSAATSCRPRRRIIAPMSAVRLPLAIRTLASSSPRPSTTWRSGTPVRCLRRCRRTTGCAVGCRADRYAERARRCSKPAGHPVRPSRLRVARKPAAGADPQPRRCPARQRQGVARRRDRWARRAAALCPDPGHEPARGAVAIDPPRHQGGGERRRRPHRRHALCRRRDDLVRRDRAHGRRAARPTSSAARDLRSSRSSSPSTMPCGACAPSSIRSRLALGSQARRHPHRSLQRAQDRDRVDARPRAAPAAAASAREIVRGGVLDPGEVARPKR